jgi:3-oxoacid CoA-transferase
MIDTLIGALAKREDIKNLVGVSNNSGGNDSGLGE